METGRMGVKVKVCVRGGGGACLRLAMWSGRVPTSAECANNLTSCSPLPSRAVRGGGGGRREERVKLCDGAGAARPGHACAEMLALTLPRSRFTDSSTLASSNAYKKSSRAEGVERGGQLGDSRQIDGGDGAEGAPQKTSRGPAQ